MLIEVEGQRSPVRFAPDSRPEFVLGAPRGVDPQGLAQIFSFSVKKGRRELVTTKVNFLRGRLHYGGEEDKASVPFEASRYSESSITITPTMRLPPGEYGIRVGAAIFCFGVNN